MNKLNNFSDIKFDNRLTTRFPKDEYDKIVEQSKKHHMTKSEYLRILVRIAFESMEENQE